MSRFPIQFIAILAVALVIYFALDFGKRLETWTELVRVEEQSEKQVASEEARQVELKERLAWIKRPEGAEWIARNDYGHARDGDNVVIPHKVPATFAPLPPVPVTPPPTPKEWWQQILDLIFGSQ
jgi:cell division protein FtsB